MASKATSNLPCATHHGCPLIEVSIPRSIEDTIKRDKRNLSIIVNSGKLPPIEWSLVRRRMESHLSLNLNVKKKIHILFIDVGRQEEDPPFILSESINVDQLMVEKKADGVVIHGTNLVYVCTFSPSICTAMYTNAEQSIHVDTKISTLSWSGIEKIANNDPSQSKEPSRSYASFGLSQRIQPSRPKSRIKSAVTRARLDALGAPSRCRVMNVKAEHSYQSVVGALYHSDFYPYFENARDSLHPRDDYYGARPNGKKSRIPRFSRDPDCSYHKQDDFFVQMPMVTSLPITSGRGYDKSLEQAAIMENRFRTISEYLLVHYFSPLPYAVTGLIARDNIREVDTLCFKKHGMHLPWYNSERIFPKGTVGGAVTKDLHDDGNACLMPSFWTSIEGNKDTAINFLGHKLNVDIPATSKRIVLFMGWIPHRVHSMRDPSFRSVGDMCRERVHHSAFAKKEYEHISLHIFSRKNRTKVVKCMLFDKEDTKSSSPTPVRRSARLETLPSSTTPVRGSNVRRSPLRRSPRRSITTQLEADAVEVLGMLRNPRTTNDDTKNKGSLNKKRKRAPSVTKRSERPTRR